MHNEILTMHNVTSHVAICELAAGFPHVAGFPCMVAALFSCLGGVVLLLVGQHLVQLRVKKAPVLRQFLNSHVEVICDVHVERRGNSARHGWRGNVPQIVRRCS